MSGIAAWQGENDRGVSPRRHSHATTDAGAGGGIVSVVMEVEVQVYCQDDELQEQNEKDEADTCHLFYGRSPGGWDLRFDVLVIVRALHLFRSTRNRL